MKLEPYNNLEIKNGIGDQKVKQVDDELVHGNRSISHAKYMKKYAFKNC